jgi:hypothetical protein
MGTDAAKRIEALVERLNVLEADRTILSTLHAYAHTIGYRLKDD